MPAKRLPIFAVILSAVFYLAGAPATRAHTGPCCLPPIVVGPPFSDNFSADTKVDPRWSREQPNPASTIHIGPAGLILGASAANGGSDLWPTTNYRASLLLQQIDPKRDWTVTTRIQFAPNNNSEGAGLIVTTRTVGFDAGSVFHRFEYRLDPTAAIGSATNGANDPASVAYRHGSVLLRLQKTGTTYVFAYAARHRRWITVSTLTDAQPYSYIGLISRRQPVDGQVDVPAKPAFKNFKITLVKPRPDR